MRTVRRFAAAFGMTTALCALAVLPAQATPTTTITVGNGTSREHQPVCSNTEPFPCGMQALQLSFSISTSHIFNYPITIDWLLFNRSATAGLDFTGPTSGTLTIAAGRSSAQLTVPLVADGYGEPTEIFTVHLTGASVPADLNSVGTETIEDGSYLPGDCTLTKNAPDHMAMTCTERPETQQWYLWVECTYGWGDSSILSNTVTGNGTSSGVCSFGQTMNSIFFRGL